MSEITPETEAPEEHPHIHALTAFMVMVDESGKAYAILQVPDGIEAAYAPDAVSVRRACVEIADDIRAQTAAAYATDMLTAALDEAKKREAPSEGVKKAFKKRGK